MAVTMPVRWVVVLAVVPVTVFAIPSEAAARKLFHSPDHRVICNIATYGGKPEALCTSRETVRRRPESPKIPERGSNRSGARVQARGKTVLVEMCNALWLPGFGSPPRTLSVHEKVETKYFVCSALSKKTMRCASKLTGHGYKVSRTTFKRF